MDQQLLKSLVCPVCHGVLRLEHRTHQTMSKPQITLNCQIDRLHFPINAGIPVLLMSHAEAWQTLADDGASGDNYNCSPLA